jgi:hypothetical protein
MPSFVLALLTLPILLVSSKNNLRIKVVDETETKTDQFSLDNLLSSQDADPKLTECLLSAVTDQDCGTVVSGCIWCKEPVYGLCVTESAAKRIGWMPFFTCNTKDDGEQVELFVEEGAI